MREIVNAILYQAHAGVQWHYLPPHSAVYYYFTLWRDDGTNQTIHDLLRRQVRESRGRKEDPSAVVLDRQTLRISPNASADTTGPDETKRSPGRKRGIATDAFCPGGSLWNRSGGSPSRPSAR
ncbi:transposase [Streptomyces sp. NPDC048496]|uniref:transposase n=1 Tax=Streptomyces sp. NPDC048496 TaxID=3365558 RepID=UPI00371C3E8A